MGTLFYELEVNAKLSQIALLGFRRQTPDALSKLTFTQQHFDGYDEAYLQMLDALEYGKTLPIACVLNLTHYDRRAYFFARAMHRHPILRTIPILGTNLDGNLSLRRWEMRLYGIDELLNLPQKAGLLDARLKLLQTQKRSAKNFYRKTAGMKSNPFISRGKRVFDIVGALSAMLLLSPVFVLTALAIMIESKGPVLYNSPRVGAGFKVFNFIKFRSMHLDAEAQLAALVHLNQYGHDRTFTKIYNDPRVTRVGRFIRKYSIDELPQLWNVLRGDMSLVGNRPLPLYEAEQLTREGHTLRFMAPAGITGLWQVSKRGRADMSTEERIALDMSYPENANNWIDLRILLKTFTAFVQQENV